jgi:hypothetical protein
VPLLEGVVDAGEAIGVLAGRRLLRAQPREFGVAGLDDVDRFAHPLGVLEQATVIRDRLVDLRDRDRVRRTGAVALVLRVRLRAGDRLGDRLGFGATRRELGLDAAQPLLRRVVGGGLLGDDDVLRLERADLGLQGVLPQVGRALLLVQVARLAVKFRDPVGCVSRESRSSSATRRTRA